MAKIIKLRTCESRRNQSLCPCFVSFLLLEILTKQEVLYNWLNLLDFTAFDVAICNHNQRTIFYINLQSRGLTLTGNLVLFNWNPPTLMDIAMKKVLRYNKPQLTP